MQRTELGFPAPPEGYLVHLAPRNRLVAWRGVKHIDEPRHPILYLDESVMEWKVLDRHISEVPGAGT